MRRTTRIPRQAYACALILTLGLGGCGITEWQRFQDQQAAAQKDLMSADMTRRICEAGAQTSACKR